MMADHSVGTGGRISRLAQAAQWLSQPATWRAAPHCPGVGQRVSAGTREYVRQSTLDLDRLVLQTLPAVRPASTGALAGGPLDASPLKDELYAAQVQMIAAARPTVTQ